MKLFYVLLILLWFKTKLTVYQPINLRGVKSVYKHSFSSFSKNKTAMTTKIFLGVLKEVLKKGYI
jgi:hypothetical protein